MVRALFSGRLRDALTKANGAFIGAQSWRNGHNNSGKQNCPAALVLASQVRQAVLNNNGGGDNETMSVGLGFLFVLFSVSAQAQGAKSTLVARRCKKKDPVQTLAWLVQHAVSALRPPCSAARQMGQTQFELT